MRFSHRVLSASIVLIGVSRRCKRLLLLLVHNEDMQIHRLPHLRDLNRREHSKGRHLLQVERIQGGRLRQLIKAVPYETRLFL